jgi:hypothetical protein
MGGDAGTSSSSGAAGSGSGGTSAAAGGDNSQTQRLERWGSCWNRYYELQTEYFMSSTSRAILERLTQDYLWMRTLSLRTSTSTRKDQLMTVNKQFQSASDMSSVAAAPIVSSVGASSGAAGAAAAVAAATARGGGSSATRSGEGSGSYSQVRAEQGFAAMAVGGAAGGGSKKLSSSAAIAAAIATNPRTVELHKAVDQLASVAMEEICQQTLQRAKQQVFGSK